MGLWESGAILVYLAEKTGKLLPADPAARYECLQWLMFQMGGVGPMFGQLGHFHKFAADKITDDYPTNRYRDETRRLLGVLDARLAERDFVMGSEYSIADIAILPWVRVLDGFYGAGELVGIADFAHVNDWVARCEARPASEVGLDTPSRG
jgi:GST-like protein